MIIDSKPSMAMLLITYRQEKYVREALLGVLSQTYSPLEIVISDDASPDNTWRIIEQTAAQYDGPHRLILNRNEKNLGLMGNLCRAISLSTASHLVMAAGDDVSEPHRVATIAKVFASKTQHDRPTLVISNAKRIDEQGSALAEQPMWPTGAHVDVYAVFDKHIVLGGAGSAYDRRVFDEFPLPDRRIFTEDAIFCQRAAMLGSIAILNEQLLNYRRHGGGLSAAPPRPTTVAMLREQLEYQSNYWQLVQDQQRCDVVWAIDRELIDPVLGRQLLNYMDRHIRNLAHSKAALNGRNIAYRIMSVLALRSYPLRPWLRCFALAVSPRFYLAGIGLLYWLRKGQ